MKFLSPLKEQKLRRDISKKIQPILPALKWIKEKLFWLKKNIPWKNMLPYCFFGFVFVYEELALRIFNKTGLFGKLIYPLLFGLGIGLLLQGITLLLNKKWRRIVSYIALSLTSILFITECLVKRTYQKYMLLSAIISGAGGVAGNYTKDLFRAIAGGILVIIAFLLPILLYRILEKKLEKIEKHNVITAVETIVAGVVIYGLACGLAGIGSTANQYKTMFEFDAGTQTFGLMTGIRLSFTRNGDDGLSIASEEDVEEEKPESYEGQYNVMDLNLDELIESDSDEYKKLDQYVNSLSPSEKNKYTGIFKDKNLILICAEAFSGAVVSEELTPTLYRMIHEGFYFSDFYQCTWGGSTISGEYSFLTGLVPTYGTDTIADVANNNEYFTLPNQLRRIGYKTGGYHDGDYDYYNRHLTHENLGFDFWMGDGNGLEEKTGRFPTDELMFEATVEDYVNDGPFCMYYMTVSGHSPYEENSEISTSNWEHVTSIIGDDHSGTVTAYYCYQYELEKAMAKLVEKLEETGHAEDTIICLCPDHYPYGLSKGSYNNPVDYYEEVCGYQIDDNVDMDHNSMIIWSECLEEGGELHDYQCEISDITYSLDIVPTLSNLFGLEFDSRLLVGRDVFSESGDKMILWNSYSWFSDQGYYNSRSDKFTPTGEMPDQEYIDKMSEIVTNKISYSKQVIDTDYYGHLFGKTEKENSKDKEK